MRRPQVLCFCNQIVQVFGRRQGQDVVRALGRQGRALLCRPFVLAGELGLFQKVLGGFLKRL
ncbi:MAG: hypothetical protein AAGG01_21930, partial [Planctomycetota bacterium]